MTKQQAESIYNQQIADAQARVDAAQKAYDDYVNSINGYYNKHVTQANTSRGSAMKYGTTTYTQTSNTLADYVLRNGGTNYTANKTGEYMSALQNAKNALSGVKMGDWDEDERSFNSQDRKGTVAPGLSANLDRNTAESDRSLRSGQMASQGIASANQTSNINAGIDRAKAGLLGANNSISQGVDTSNNLFTANRATDAATQADYLQKMASADALDIQAENIMKGSKFATLSAGLQGAATGMSSGAALAATSDENEKESPYDVNELITQFRSLYKRLQDIKGGK